MKKLILSFLPITLLYALIVFVFGSSELSGDEHRYIKYATNLTQGYFVDPANIDIRNGPMYSVLLAPFVALGTPLWVPKLLNVVFLTGALICIYLTLSKYTRPRVALISAYLMGLYPQSFKWVGRLYSDAFAFALICVCIFFFVRWVHAQEKEWKWGILAAVAFAFLALTKLIFAQVLTVCIVLSVLGLVIFRSHLAWKSLFSVLLAYVLCLPYLGYTYSITDKFPLWGTNGGEQLYWMASPYEGELGNWVDNASVLEKRIPELNPNHFDFYNSLEGMSGIDRNKAFLQKGVENLKAYPQNYLKHWIANMGRFFLNYPYSFKEQNMGTFAYMIPNMIVLLLVAFGSFVVFNTWKDVPTEFWLLLLFISIYIGGSSLVHASTRYFWMIIPVLTVWLGWIFGSKLKIQILRNSLIPTEGDDFVEEKLPVAEHIS
ncbi:MAG: glycosyltransferase family 39 protein [Bacteroidota bacterium]